jgi:hypothetical protein
VGEQKPFFKKFIYLCGRKTIAMAKKKYDNDNSVTMASEPSLAYVGSISTHKAMLHTDSMTVDEYFEKVRRAIDRRYENL